MKKSNALAGARTPFQKWVDKYQGLFYLIPWIIGFLVFKAFPFGQSLYYSFTDMNSSRTVLALLVWPTTLPHSTPKRSPRH